MAVALIHKALAAIKSGVQVEACPAWRQVVLQAQQVERARHAVIDDLADAKCMPFHRDESERKTGQETATKHAFAFFLNFIARIDACVIPIIRTPPRIIGPVVAQSPRNITENHK